MNQVPGPVITLIWVATAAVTLIGLTARYTRRRIAHHLRRHGDYYGATLIDPHQERNDR